MKPIIPLYAIGVYTILQSIVIFFAVDIIVPQIFNTTPEGIEIAILIHQFKTRIHKITNFLHKNQFILLFIKNHK